MKKIALLSVIAASALMTACASKIGEGNVPAHAQNGDQFSAENYQQVLDKTYRQEETDLQRQDGKVYGDKNAAKNRTATQ